MTSLQFAAKHVFFSGAVPAWAPCLPDYSWLDSDQQYHFVKVEGLCNYRYEEAVIVYLLQSPMSRFSANLLDIFEYKTLQNRNGQWLVGWLVFRTLLAKQNVKKLVHFAV